MRHENKQEVVKKLEELILLIKPHFRKLEYVIATPSNKEYVLAWTKENVRYQICVTADSEMALVLDVIEKIFAK